MDVDLYRYDEKWERDASTVLRDFYEYTAPTNSTDTYGLHAIIVPKQDTRIIDMRHPSDFVHFSLPEAVNVPLSSRDTPGPFADPSILRALWKKLDKTFKEPTDELKELLDGKRLLLVCYDGDSSRVATSVLRASGYEADSIRGGFRALEDLRRNTDTLLKGEEETEHLESWKRMVRDENLGIAQAQST